MTSNIGPEGLSSLQKWAARARGAGSSDAADRPSAGSTKRINRFLTQGGFVYWDKHDDVVGVEALMEEDDGRLSFDGPLPLPTWQLRGALEKEKRVHRVTRTELVSGGITSFCWLAPGEKDPGSERATLRLIPAARPRLSLAAIGPRAERCGARVARWCPRHL